MKSHSFKLPEIPVSEQTPLVQWLLQIILEQQRRIEQLEEEVHKLKGETVKPKIEPSRMDKETASQEEREEKGRSKPGPKRKKTQELTIHRTEIVEVEEVPVGSTFKGYEDYVVQDLLIQPHNTCYRLEQWQTPEGKYVSAIAGATVGLGDSDLSGAVKPASDGRSRGLSSGEGGAT